MPIIITVGGFDPGTASKQQPLVLLFDYADGNIRLRGEALIDTRAAVGRAVVDDDDLVVGIILMCNAVQALSEIFLYVINGNDYRESHIKNLCS